MSSFVDSAFALSMAKSGSSCIDAMVDLTTPLAILDIGQRLL